MDTETDPPPPPDDGDASCLETAPFPSAFPAAPTVEDRPDELARFLHHLADAQPLITADPENPGEPPARYIIGDELGAGAVSQVVFAHDEHLGRDVAIKVMPATGAISRERLSRFLAEAQITAQLEHPAVPPVYEMGQMPGGLPYFAMRLVRGESLDELINQLRVGDPAHVRRFTVPARVRLFLRICQGLAYAHAKGVVHRDLKPANILLGRYGEVQIMDWGLAKLVAPPGGGPGVDAPLATRHEPDGGDPPSIRLPRPPPVTTMRSGRATATLDGEVAGTPAYMSPEQARGRNTKVGPASDVYALGLILAELVTLVRVMRPCSSVKPARRYDRPVEASALNPRISLDAEMAELIRTCTQPDPERRFPHAGALEQALRTYLERHYRGVSLRARGRPNGMLPGAARSLLPEGAGRGRLAGVFGLVFFAGWGGMNFILDLAGWVRRWLGGG